MTITCSLPLVIGTHCIKILLNMLTPLGKKVIGGATIAAVNYIAIRIAQFIGQYISTA